VSEAKPQQTPTSPVKWTLGDVFFFMTILCVLLSVVGWIGTASIFLWLCVFASAVLTISFTLILPYKNPGGSLIPLTIVLAIAFFGPLTIFSVVVLLNCVLHFFLIKRIGKPVSYKTALKGSLVCTAISFFVGALFGVSGYRELQQAREQFIPVSIESRLDYEPDVDSDQGVRSQLPFHWGAMELERNRQDHHFFSRIRQLEGLHDERVESFIKSPGFGVSRMFMPNPSRLLKESQPPTITFDSEDWTYSNWRYNYMPPGDDLETAHIVIAGIGTEMGERIGFVPHAAFHPPHRNGFTDDWQLKSLQLVSLRRFDKPKAYDLDHLPRMDHLSGEDAPTRDLNEFETGALQKLENGESIVISKSEDGKELVAVGALLAIDSCRECHSARRGELLGAFTYEFQYQGKESSGIADGLQLLDEPAAN